MTRRRQVTQDDISTLRSLLSATDAQLVGPEDSEPYKSSIRRWSRAAEQPAGVCLVPRPAEAISITLKYASEHNLDVAVKGGGHSTAGASSTNGGLLIDLNTHLRSTEVDVEKKVIRVGGGALWGDVDAALAPHGLATVGGTVADTGVGGLTLGGGFGWLSAKHGLVVDNLVSCTVVLADGRIVTASKDQEQDLFWALRGAGQNFGVAIEFVYRVYEQGGLWAGFNIFPPTPEVITQVVDAMNDIYSPGPDGSSKASGKASCGIGFVKPPPAGGETMFFVMIVYDGPGNEGTQLFRDVLGAGGGPLMSTMAIVTYENANKLMQLPIGAQASLKGASFELPLRTSFVLEVADAYRMFTEKFPDAKGSQIVWELLDPMKIMEISNASMAFANRGRHFNAAITPLWYDEENDEACRQWSRDVALLFKKELDREGTETDASEGGSFVKRGEHGATMVYGNYDRKYLSFPGT